jgi:ABC-type branched-subunit amino acid transport system permease subunit
MIIIRAIDVISFHYLHLPIPSMFFFGIVLMLVALFIPEGLLSSPWVKRVSRALVLKTTLQRIRGFLV